MAYGFPMIGDLRQLPHEELERTNTCLKAMLAQRQKDMDFRKDIDKNVKSLQEERDLLARKLHSAEDAARERDKLVEFLKGQLDLCSEKAKTDHDKLVADKDDLNKRYLHIQCQQSQYQNEIRRKDADLKRLQDQVRCRIAELVAKNCGQVAEVQELHGADEDPPSDTGGEEGWHQQRN